VKADLERELEDFSLNCTKCRLDVHWVAGLGVTPGLGASGARAGTASRRSHAAKQAFLGGADLHAQRPNSCRHSERFFGL
jgi:hypothetical protein